MAWRHECLVSPDRCSRSGTGTGSIPLYAHVRQRGHSREDAQDLVQHDFLRLIETRFIDAAQPEAGRFRAFLLHTMKQFLIDQRRREEARKRGRGAVPVVRGLSSRS